MTKFLCCHYWRKLGVETCGIFDSVETAEKRAVQWGQEKDDHIVVVYTREFSPKKQIRQEN